MDIPEKINYKYNTKKALTYVLVGLGLTLGSIIVPVVRILVFIVGLMVTFTGLGALVRRKPQLLLDKEGLYIGFKIKRKIPWRFIDATSVKKEKVDDRLVWYLRVRTKSVKGGVIGYNNFEANLDLLKIDSYVLKEQLNHFRGI